MVSISNELYTDRKGRVCRAEGGEHKPRIIYMISGLNQLAFQRRPPSAVLLHGACR